MVSIEQLLRERNPWWDGSTPLPEEGGYLRRMGIYDRLSELAFMFQMRRALILLGQRRVGKTVLLMQLLKEAVTERGMKREHVCYVEFDEKFADTSPSDVLRAYRKMTGPGQRLFLLDEMPVSGEWMRSFKAYVDRDKEIKVVLTGSATAITRAKRAEYALGRFLGYYIHPLLFCEYLAYTNKWPTSLPKDASFEECFGHRFDEKELAPLNEAFLSYLRFGAFPEIALNEGRIHPNKIPAMVHDIVGDVLLGHGALKEFHIDKSHELRKILEYLSSINGQESSVEAISRNVDNISKESVRKYVDFLESSFLVHKHSKLNPVTGKERLRNRNAKYLLCNPSFSGRMIGLGPEYDSGVLGHVAEAAAVVQHPNHAQAYCPRVTNYYRHKQNGGYIEIDIVRTTNDFEAYIDQLCEIKWSDKREVLGRARHNIRLVANRFKTRVLDQARMICTTKSTYGNDERDDRIVCMPTAQYCMAQGIETLGGHGHLLPPPLRYIPDDE